VGVMLRVGEPDRLAAGGVTWVLDSNAGPKGVRVGVAFGLDVTVGSRLYTGVPVGSRLHADNSSKNSTSAPHKPCLIVVTFFSTPVPAWDGIGKPSQK